VWTLVLTATMVVGLLLIPRRPVWGWSCYLFNEALWLVYAHQRNDHALVVMALVTGAVGIRNLRVARRLA
jgi:lipid-A-disaccharide synthase-like uncharacterized protein